MIVHILTKDDESVFFFDGTTHFYLFPHFIAS